MSIELWMTKSGKARGYKCCTVRCMQPFAETVREGRKTGVTAPVLADSPLHSSLIARPIHPFEAGGMGLRWGFIRIFFREREHQLYWMNLFAEFLRIIAR